MNRKKVDTVMTKEQWKQEIKKDLKKAVHDTIEQVLCWAVISAMFLALPVGMCIHFFLSSGY